MPSSSRPCENPRRRAASRRRGFTFVELVMVMTVLVVLAGLVLFRAGDASAQGRIDAVRASMVVVRDAICGTDRAPGYQSDMGELPAVVADLFRLPTELSSGSTGSDGAAGRDPTFDPLTGRGWNGPYLMRPTGRYLVDPSRGFTGQYGQTNEPALLDSWEHPIVLQYPSIVGLGVREQERFVRLVSAGPDGVLNTSPAALKPDLTDMAQVGDDVVVYLFRANGP